MSQRPPVSGGVWRWGRERKADREKDAALVDALYLVPFVAAAEDLHSRLGNLLFNDGLVPLRARDRDRRYATETLFLLARFFAYEQQLLRFTFLAIDLNVLQAAKDVRKVLSTAQGGIDPWCMFGTTQTALGQSVIVWRTGQVPFADTMSVVEFEQQLAKGLARELNLADAIDKLSHATVISELGQRSVQRLQALHESVGALLTAVDAHVFESGRRFPARGSSRTLRRGNKP